MLQNIQLQLSTILPMLLILYFSYGDKRLQLKSARIYRTLLLVTLLCIAADIVSVIGIVAAPHWEAVILCKLYLGLTVWTGYVTVYYLACDVRAFRKQAKLRRTLTGINAALSALIVPLPIELFNHDGMIYSLGPAVTFTFGISALYIAAAFALTFAFKGQINPRRRDAIRLWMLLEAGGALIQYANRRLLLVGYTMSLGIVILYAAVENPEAGRDRTTGVYSYQMLVDYLRELFDAHRSCALVIVVADFKGEDAQNEDAQNEDAMLALSGFLNTLSGNRLFRGYGNDFIMAFPDRQAAEDALPRLRARFEARRAEGSDLRSDVYIIPDTGFVQSPEDMMTLYHSFLTYGGQSEAEVTVVDKAVYDQIMRYRDVQREVADALEEDRVEVFLQPIYAVGEDRFVSAEALVRMRDRAGDIVMPGAFIPMAEKSALIERIGERVFEKVLRWIRDNDLRALGLDYIEVNLAVAQCENGALAARFSELIRRYDILPAAINLEITESGQIHRKSVLMNNLRALKGLGCSFSLDDFGTGESNLDYIVDMPVDVIKFDRTMILSYFSNERTRLMMQYITRMVKSMGMRIVAEGVEEKDQLEALEALGVDYIQGFYFSKPLPMDEFVTFIETHRKQKTGV